MLSIILFLLIVRVSSEILESNSAKTLKKEYGLFNNSDKNGANVCDGNEQKNSFFLFK